MVRRKLYYYYVLVCISKYVLFWLLWRHRGLKPVHPPGKSREGGAKGLWQTHTRTGTHPYLSPLRTPTIFWGGRTYLEIVCGTILSAV